ncbi:hypothetical protein M9H77_19110 [Catharanthus roseus]|uniref:Uncharacterized protein n=1 Tax=Catharanthus roseus TaxID=4058 RepID=A0ACC0B9C8_CATRO|nr:hypothetical protein M9H77_19110 [Catharanthus roseus]
MAAETPSFKLQPRTPIPATQHVSSSSTQYFTKPIITNLTLTSFTETPEFKVLQNFLHRLLPQGCQWLPDDPTKTQTYYELIVVDSNSVEITHTPDRNNPQKIAYSKCTIKKIIKSTEWASIWSTRSFSVPFKPQGYTYQDYRMAWYRTFFKRPFDHSWFFIFHQNCSKDFPIWFYEWWFYFGSLLDILPPIPMLGFQTWMKKMPGPKYVIPVSFFAELQVLWIFCWSYKLDKIHSSIPDFPLCLIREFKIKWWIGYSVEFCSQETVLNFLQTSQKIQKSIRQLPKPATIPTTPAKIQPSPTADSSLSKITTADEEQFQEFLRFKAFQNKMKQTASSPDSSQDSSTDPFGGPCAQDPFDL